MKKLFFLFLIFAFTLFAATIMNYFRIFSIGPDFFIISIVFASIFFDPIWAVGFSMVTGILKDSFTCWPFGINTILLPLYCLLIIKVCRRVSLEDSFAYGILIFIATILNNIVIRLIFWYLGYQVTFWFFLKLIILEPVYTALLSLLLFRYIHPLKIPYSSKKFTY